MMGLSEITARVRAAELAAGRVSGSAQLIAVSKVQPTDRVEAVLAQGHLLFGENYVQETQAKWPDWRATYPGVQVHMIGPLQTNKAKLVAEFAHEFQALDSLRVANALDRHLQQQGRSLDVFVQINTSGEASKYGLAPEEAPAFLQALSAFSALRVRGFMTLALLSAEADQVRECFVRLRTLRDELRQTAPAGMSLDELSMGMSGDFEIAIEEGATVVRVGQAIYGARALPDSYYWPTGPEANAAI